MAPSVLDEILAHKRREVAQARERLPLEVMMARARQAPPVRPFATALAGPWPKLIAEVKARSPSKGLLRPHMDPVALACAYARAGAAAISVLTDERYFGGSLAHLTAVRQALPHGPPLLRKDFIFDPYQVYESRACGADALLLIVACLRGDELGHLISLTRELGMEALVEVHDEEELWRAVQAGAAIIGINNRDLRTFAVDLSTTERLIPLIPKGVKVVAESGIHTQKDVMRMAALGVHALLIGEALVTAPDPEAKIRELLAIGS
jgi:indole-3-glycerol phosphate synthase